MFMQENPDDKKVTPSYEDLTRGTFGHVMRSQEEFNDKDSYSTTVLGLDIEVHKDVFSPKYFGDTEIFAKKLSEILKTHPRARILEIGPGTGALSIHAALSGSHVSAVDINPAAVANTQANIGKHADKIQKAGGSVSVSLGDVYDSLQNEKYDLIIWNTPFALVPNDAALSPLQKAVADAGYDATRRFIEQAPTHLNTDGVIVVGFSDTLGNLPLISVFATNAGLNMNKIDSQQWVEGGNPVTFDMYELQRGS